MVKEGFLDNVPSVAEDKVGHSVKEVSDLADGSSHSEKIIPNVYFDRFQRFLRLEGNVDMNKLSRDLEKSMKKHIDRWLKEFKKEVDSNSSGHLEEENEDLACLLILHYSLCWAVAHNFDSDPDELEYINYPAIPRLARHRKSLKFYAANLGLPYGSVLACPEREMTSGLIRRLEKIANSLRCPKGNVSLMPPVFAKNYSMDRDRVYAFRPTKQVAALWGRENFRDAINESDRLQSHLDEFLKQTGMSTSRFASYTA